MNLYFDEEEAVIKLRELGYRVVKEDFSEITSIGTIKDLVQYFFARRLYYNKERKYPYSIDYKENIKHVSSFIKAREKLGLSRKYAIKEAAVLVDALFKYEAHLKLKSPIISPVILTNRPVMDWVCSFINGEVSEVAEIDTRILIDEINEMYEKEFYERDFEEAKKDREEILRRLHGSY